MKQTSSLGQDFAPMSLVNRILWIGFAAYVAILPVGATTALRNLLFVIVLGALGSMLWRTREWPRVPVRLPWLALLLPALVSLTYSADLNYSLGELKTEIGVPFLIFAMTATIVHDEQSFLRFLRILMAANVFLVAFSLATAVAGGTTKDDLVGTLNTGVGYYSTYLSAVMPFIALFLWRCKERGAKMVWAVSLLLVANLASLYVSGNRQGLLAVLAELAVFVLIYRNRLTRKHWALIAMGGLSVCGLFLVQFLHRDASAASGLGRAMSNDVRWPVWHACIQALGDHPWTGSGFGLRIFQIAYPQFSANGPFWHAHNVLLNKGIQMGIPGIVGFLFLFFSIPWRMLRSLRLDCLVGATAAAGIAMSIGFLLKNMTDDFFYRESGYVFWLLVGAVLGLCYGANANANANANAERSKE
ncbi:MAG TPA: O-antigen ligase family protein [Rhodocyclaceae bacterium]|nr:O-antigen ligase family protein [Rhodocyclaceae bacterium]